MRAEVSMYRSGKQTYVVVGVDDDIAKRVDKARLWMRLKLQRPVTRTEALRQLIKYGLKIEEAVRDPLPPGFIGLNTEHGFVSAAEFV
jgi:hypothetical protein